MLSLPLTFFVISTLSISFWSMSRTVIVEGASMEPSHPSGTRLVACKAYWLVGSIGRNDVIAFEDPEDPAKYLIKRVVSLDGDLVPSSYLSTELPARSDYKVPPGEIYVVGDNSAVSVDSRVFGPISSSKVIGKCIHLWGGSMTLPFIAGTGAILMIVSLATVLRHGGNRYITRLASDEASERHHVTGGML